MSAEDRNDLPDLSAGGDRPGGDPESSSFDQPVRPHGGPPPSTGDEPGRKPEEKPEEKPAEKEKGKGGGTEERRVFVGTGLFWGLIVGVVLAILVVVFAAQNTQDATVKMLVWDWSSPLFVVILISLIAGIVLDEIVGLIYRARRRRRLTEKEELERLRAKR